MTQRMHPYAINIDDERRTSIQLASDHVGIPRAEIFRRMVDHWVNGGKVEGLPPFPSRADMAKRSS